jgi:hypothetical protein
VPGPLDGLAANFDPGRFGLPVSWWLARCIISRRRRELAVAVHSVRQWPFATLTDARAYRASSVGKSLANDGGGE